MSGRSPLPLLSTCLKKRYQDLNCIYASALAEMGRGKAKYRKARMIRQHGTKRRRAPLKALSTGDAIVYALGGPSCYGHYAY
ncbi:unnamed protein product, partial [Iphiclides podalirius]